MEGSRVGLRLDPLTSSEPVLRSLPEVIPGSQDYVLFPQPSGKLEPLPGRRLQDKETKLYIFELRKGLHGLGFKCRVGEDKKIRIWHVYTDQRSPVLRQQNLSQLDTESASAKKIGEELILEGDIVIQVDDRPVETMQELDEAIFEAPQERYVCVHVLREGWEKLEQEEKRRQTEAMIASNSAEAVKKRDEELRLMEYQQKMDRQLAIRKLARGSPLIQEFIKECEARFTVPDTELVLKMREAFGPQRDLQPGSHITKLELGGLVCSKPMHIFIMCEVIYKFRQHLFKDKLVEVDFGWRDMDRMTLYSIAKLLGTNETEPVLEPVEVDVAEKQHVEHAENENEKQDKEEDDEETNAPETENKQGEGEEGEASARSQPPAVRKRFTIRGQGINTGLEIPLEKPCLYGNSFLLNVVSAFAEIETLQSISLARSSINDLVSDKLVQGLMHCTSGTVKNLTLNQNSFGKHFADSFGAALAAEDSNPCKKLETLSLAWNDLGELGGIPLFTRLLDAKQSMLREIDVSFNGLTDEVAVPIRKLLESDVLPNLYKLNLSHNRFKHKGGMEIASALRVNKVLGEFSIGFNALGFNATVAVIASVKSSSTMELLEVENTCGDYMEGSVHGVRVVCEDKEYEKFGDDIIQYLWDLKEQMNILRCKNAENQIEVKIEYPFKQRECLEELKWFHKPLEIGTEKKDESSNRLSLAVSIFKDRCKESDSRAFFDTINVVQTAMKTDWQFLHPKLCRFIKKDVSQIDLIHDIVAERYFSLSNIFRCYAAAGDEHDCLGFVEFLDMMSKCKVTDKNSCPETAAQGAFIAANVEIEAETKAEQNAMDENPDNAMCLYEFIEALIRLGLRKFYDKQSPKKAESEAEAVEWILDRHIIRYCKSFDSNTFRRDKIYFLDVISTFETYKLKIDKVWREYAGSSGANLLMEVDHWKEFCSGTGLSSVTYLDTMRKKEADVPVFPPGTITFAFWAAQTMIRNQLIRNVREKSRNRNDALTYTEFLEALARLADSIQGETVKMELGLPPDALLSEKLVVVLELMLGATLPDVFSKAKYPALLNSLRDNHVQMEWPHREDYVFESDPLNMSSTKMQPLEEEAA